MLGAALLAMAVWVPFAAGASLSPNPDFPEDDFNSENWVSVDISDSATAQPCDWTNCAFGTEDEQWDWYVGGPAPYSYACYGHLEGVLSPDGEVEVSGISLYAPSSGPFCSNNQPANLPWYDGQVCLSTVSGKAWLRLPIQLGYLVGETFGELVNNGGEFEAVQFSNTIFNHQHSSIATVRHTAELPLAEAVSIAADGDQQGCGWPELQS